MSQLEYEKITSLANSSDTHAYTTWVEINKNALIHNLIQYKSILNSTKVAPVIKSNAYGHGIREIAQICDEHVLVDMLCTVSLSEALYLRSVGIHKPLLVLSILDTLSEKIPLLNISVTIYDLTTAHLLNEIGKKARKKVHVHIKIDTGLSRLGILAHEAVQFIHSVAQLPYLYIEGMFTHFANSERSDQTFLEYQLTQFEYVCTEIQKMKLDIPLLHTTCSAAIVARVATHYTMARLGIGMYGLWPSDENKNLCNTLYPAFHLQPVLTWKTSIIQVKEIPAGSFVGYDLTYRTHKKTKIGVLPIGYWDGYDRELSNNSVVLINTQYAPVVGRIAMNMMMIDISDIEASVGDQVILLGNYANIGAYDIARRCNTIPYEITTRINPLLPRIMI